jgi:hypothetical protein
MDDEDEDSKSYRSRLRTRAVLKIRHDHPTQPSTSSASTIVYTASGRRSKPTHPQSFASSSNWNEEDDDLEDEPRSMRKKRRII